MRLYCGIHWQKLLWIVTQQLKAYGFSRSSGSGYSDSVYMVTLYNGVTIKWQLMIYFLLLLSRFSRVQLCATPWTAAYQAPPSMGFYRQEYWSGVPLPSPVHVYMCMYKCAYEKWKRHSLSCVRLLATPRTAAYQAPPSMGFYRQEYWSGVLLPSPIIHTTLI